MKKATNATSNPSFLWVAKQGKPETNSKTANISQTIFGPFIP